MTDTPTITSLDQMIEKCYADASFKQRLLADPRSTLAAEGLILKDGLTLNVVENTDTVMNIVIPARAATSGELSDADLEAVAGGGMIRDFFKDLFRPIEDLVRKVF